MTSDDFDSDNGAGPRHEHEPEIEEALEEAFELDKQHQIFLEMRRQNLDLLRIAIQIAGYSGAHALLKPSDLKHALGSIWEAFAELYTWVDPEEAEGDQEDDDNDVGDE